MKKTLIAMAALAATGAFAQVTVYGRLDVGYAGVTASANGVDTNSAGVSSHNSVSSLWGIKGSDDLGGGLKAEFMLEQNVYTADGQSGNTGSKGGTLGTTSFDRESKIGLNSSSLGVVWFGMTTTPTFQLAAANDVFSTARFSAMNINKLTVSAANSMISYYSPVIAGFQVKAAWKNGVDSSQVNNQSTTTGDFEKLTDLTVNYATGPLQVGAGYSAYEKSGTTVASVTMGGAAAGATYDKLVGTNLTGSYNFGSFKLNANTSAVRATIVSGGADALLAETNLGVTVPLGKTTLIGQVGRNTVKIGSSTDDYSGTDYMLGADYALSTKTAVFARMGRYNTVSNSVNDYKTTGTAVGIRTVF